MTFFSLLLISLAWAGYSRDSQDERYHSLDKSSEDGVDVFSPFGKQSPSSLSSPTDESAEALAAVLFSLGPSLPSWYASRADRPAVLMSTSARAPLEDEVSERTPDSTLYSTKETTQDELMDLVIGNLDGDEKTPSNSTNATREDAVMDDNSALDAAEGSLRDLVLDVLDEQGVEGAGQSDATPESGRPATNASPEQGETRNESSSVEDVAPGNMPHPMKQIDKATLEAESEKLLEELKTIIKESSFEEPEIEPETSMDVESGTNIDANLENVLASLQNDIPQMLWKAPDWDFFDEDFKLIDQTGQTVEGLEANRRLLQFLQSLRRAFSTKEWVEVDFADTDSFTRKVFPRRAFRVTWKIQSRIGKSILSIDAESSWHFSDENKLDYVRLLRFSANGVDVKVWPAVALSLTELDDLEKQRDVLIEDAMKANLQVDALKDSLAEASANRARASSERAEKVRVAKLGLETMRKQLTDLRPVHVSAPVQDLALDGTLKLMEVTAAEFSTHINILLRFESVAQQEFQVLLAKLEMDIFEKTIERNELIKKAKDTHISWKQAVAAMVDSQKANREKVKEWANQMRNEEAQLVRKKREGTVAAQDGAKTTGAQERRRKNVIERMAMLKVDSERKGKAEAARQASLKEAAERKAKRKAAQNAKAKVELKASSEAEASRNTKPEAMGMTRLKAAAERKAKGEVQRKKRLQANVERNAEMLAKVLVFLKRSSGPTAENKRRAQLEPRGQASEDDQRERTSETEPEENDTSSQEDAAMNIEAVLDTLKDAIQRLVHKEPDWTVFAENFRVIDQDGLTIASLTDTKLLANLLRWMSEDFVVNDKGEVDFNDTKAFTRWPFPRRSFAAHWEVQLRGEQRDKSKRTLLRRFGFWSPRQSLVDIDMDAVFHFNAANKVDYVRITGINADRKRLSIWPNITLSDALDENATKAIAEWVAMLRS